MSVIIFSFDTQDVLRAAQQYQAIKNNPALEGSIMPVFGSWRGKVEQSYVMNTDDFKAHVLPLGWVDNQEAFLVVSSCNKAYAHLWYPREEGTEACWVGLGSMHQVTAQEALASEGWTYRPDMNAYWVCKTGNPDRSVAEIMQQAQVTVPMAAE